MAKTLTGARAFIARSIVWDTERGTTGHLPERVRVGFSDCDLDDCDLSTLDGRKAAVKRILWWISTRHGRLARDCDLGLTA